jgi:hypothetical protein
LSKERKCPTCGETVEGAANRVFCSKACAGRKAPADNALEVRAALRELSVDKSMIREVLAEEVREQIGQHIRDNLLGAVEDMVGLGPTVVAALKEDLDTKDWAVRSRAYQYWLRYILPMVKDAERKDEKDDRTVVIVQNIPAPDVTVEYVEDAEYEPFEADWPTCTQCDERKHPDMIDEEDGMCSACRARLTWKVEALEG